MKTHQDQKSLLGDHFVMTRPHPEKPGQVILYCLDGDLSPRKEYHFSQAEEWLNRTDYAHLTEAPVVMDCTSILHALELIAEDWRAGRH